MIFLFWKIQIKIKISEKLNDWFLSGKIVKYEGNSNVRTLGKTWKSMGKRVGDLVFQKKNIDNLDITAKNQLESRRIKY